MGDRFYQQQQRRKRMPWEEEKKQQAIEMYTAEEPTSENSMEVVKSISTELGESPNGVRNILVRAGVYVKKTPATRSSSSKTNGGRVSVADAQATLANAIRDTGEEPDNSIISKLTGKAANYFAGIINKVNE
jgi:transposase-like protein